MIKSILRCLIELKCMVKQKLTNCDIFKNSSAIFFELFEKLGL